MSERYTDMNTEVTRTKGGFTIRGYKKGGGGGGGSGGITEEADNLHSISYAQILCMLGEGEWQITDDNTDFAGILQNILLDGTPIVNDDGSYNFSDVTVEVRTGTQDQSHIAGTPSVESTTDVGTPLTAGVPWSHAFYNTELNAVRITLGVQALTQTSSTGNISGYTVGYAIDVQTDGGAFAQVLVSAFSGKTTQPYQRTHRIELPKATSGWIVRVRRTTPDSTSSLIADKTFIASYGEVIDAKLRYPMSALLYLKVNAKQFSAVPTIAVRFKMLISKVPSNYDPDTRTYSGIWDGTFKMAWHDNPAWAFYAIVENDRFGLGDRVPTASLSQLKWVLYPIGQYCDEMVPDGFGGTEPRFTCNVYLQSQADAWKVLNDFASIFRGMCYEMAGTILVSADMPSDPVYTFGNANVIDGKFTKIGTARKTRNSIALVSYNNPENMDKQAVEPVVDRTALARYGLRQTSMTAFGCRSRGQAVRFGQWTLLNSWINTQAFTFVTGLDHACVQPGKIIRVADQHFTGKRISGRIRSVSPDGLTLTLDGEVPVVDFLPITADSTAGTSDNNRYTADYAGWAPKLVVNLASGVSESRTFTYTTTTDADGNVIVNTVTVSSPYSETPEPEHMWAIEQKFLNTQLARVISVIRESPITATIAAVQYTPSLLETVDYGTKLDILPVTVVSSVQAPPSSVSITSYNTIEQNTSTTNLTITCSYASGATLYDFQWKRDDSNWVTVADCVTPSIDILNAFSGTYVARARAKNIRGIPSPWVSSNPTVISGLLPAPDAPSTLLTQSKVFSIRVYWTIPTNPNIIALTRILYNSIDDLATAQTLIDVAYPTNAFDYTGLSAGQSVYFWIQFIDRNGTIGSVYPALHGVKGTTSTSAAEILTYLAGQISETQLATQLNSRINLVDGNGAGSVNARIASSEQTLSSSIGANSAAIQTLQTTTAKTNGDLAAMWSIKTQVTSGGRTYLAGIGVGVENTSGITEAQVLVRADRFAIINSNNDTNIAVPFSVVGGQTFINSAFIQDASITNAKIADATITTAKIQNAAVDTLKLAGQAVTIPQFAYTAAFTGYISHYTAMVVQTLTVTLPETAPVQIQMAFYNSGGPVAYVQLLRDGLPILTMGVDGFAYVPRAQSWSWPYVDNPGVGAHTYALIVTTADAGMPNIGYRSIIATVLRR